MKKTFSWKDFVYARVFATLHGKQSPSCIIILLSKPNRLWILLAGLFLTNAIVAAFMGVKLFSLEKTFGYQPVNCNLFGQSGLAL